ncbi:addiction module protein [Alkalimarinus coralli]|uniref:addiction module protein n=1 Tax=Alkalimarinus coralli TaxID=2935863 RepID=UPI00202B36EF|nr:addiction module protein [Alkalimarinus coralli]
MSIKQVLESTKHLNSSERAMLAHCLISSLDSTQDQGVEEAWGKLAEKRFQQLESGEVKGVSWSEIKKDTRGE